MLIQSGIKGQIFARAVINPQTNLTALVNQGKRVVTQVYTINKTSPARSRPFKFTRRPLPLIQARLGGIPNTSPNCSLFCPKTLAMRFIIKKGN